MKKIPETYEGRADQKGFSFFLIQECGEIGKNRYRVAVYSKQGSGKTSYETVIVRKQKKPYIIQGITIREVGDEYLPSPSEWGTFGWTYSDRASALSKASEIKERLSKSEVE